MTSRSLRHTRHALAWLASALLVWALFVSACSKQTSNPDGGNEQTPADGGNIEQSTQAIRASGPNKALDPEARGPYAVGVMTVRTEDPKRVDKSGKARPMVIEIWYPAVDAAKDTKKDVYNPMEDAPKAAADEMRRVGAQIPTLSQDAHRDADPLRAEGPYPLLIFSHGSGGIRFQSVFQCTHLASHGYVVISVDHDGNTLYDLAIDRSNVQQDIAKSATDRPLDVQFLYEYAKKIVADSNHRLHQLFEPENLGITGHSFGGFTSIIGTRVLDKLKVSIPQAPFTFGGSSVVKPEHIANVHVMVLAAQKDNTLDYTKEQKGFYQTMLKPEFFEAERYLVTLTRGGHFSFSNICEFDLGALAKKFGLDASFSSILTDGCSPTDNTPIDFAHKMINRYSTALFNVILRKSEGSRQYLKKVDSTEISFEAKIP